MKIFLLMTLTLLMTNLTFAASDEDTLQTTRSIKYWDTCVQVRQPAPPLNNDDLGNFAITGFIDLQDRSGEKIRNLNIGNIWLYRSADSSQSFEACEAERWNNEIQNTYKNRYEVSAGMDNQLKIFKDFYHNRNTVWVSAVDHTCYKKILSVKSLPLKYNYHPVTGMQPETLLTVKQTVTCIGDGSDVTDPETITPTMQTKIVPINGTFVKKGTDCALQLSYSSVEKKIVIQVFDQVPKNGEACNYAGQAFTFSPYKSNVNHYQDDSKTLPNINMINESSLTFKNGLYDRKAL